MTKPEYQPPGTTILTVEAGSTLYGVSGEDGVDDLDLISIVVEHPAYVTGLKTWGSHAWRTAGKDQQSQAGDVDHVYHALRKFVGLACQGNPSILSCLYAPLTRIHHADDTGRSLMTMASQMVSRQAIPRFRGYMRSQALRLLGEKGHGRGARTGARPELVERYGYDTKFAYHMVRLGLQGLELCQVGALILPLDGDAHKTCTSIRRGEIALNEALQLAFDLDAELAAYQEGRTKTILRAEPRLDLVNAWLHQAYMDTWARQRSAS